VAGEHDINDAGRGSSVEELLAGKLEGTDAIGRPLSRRARQTRRSVEAYLKAGVRPRWMERLAEIDRGIAFEKQRIAHAYQALARECGGHPRVFERRWRTVARSWSFDDGLNELICQHNEWYPVERDLPMDPRTRDYIRLGGRSYRRPVLGPEWLLEHFPASLPRRSAQS
jgi:hypothetical protein